jgi:SHS family lactate transporter-like MFS transporter
MTIPVAPLYLLTTDYTMIVVFFTLQGFFGGGGMHTQWPHYLSKRFPTEVRATATGFCYHQGLLVHRGAADCQVAALCCHP